MNWLARQAFGGLSDDTLRDMLDHAFHDRLRNFRVGTSDADDEELEELTAI